MYCQTEQNKIAPAPAYPPCSHTHAQTHNLCVNVNTYENIYVLVVTFFCILVHFSFFFFPDKLYVAEWRIRRNALFGKSRWISPRPREEEKHTLGDVKPCVYLYFCMWCLGHMSRFHPVPMLNSKGWTGCSKFLLCKLLWLEPLHKIASPHKFYKINVSKQ